MQKNNFYGKLARIFMVFQREKKKNFWNICEQSSFWQLKVLDLGAREPRKNFFELGGREKPNRRGDGKSPKEDFFVL